MKFISNNQSNHLRNLDTLIRSADEVYIAVAFLKVSGLNGLLPSIKQMMQAGKHINVIAGQNFGLTEPAALDCLRKLFLGYQSANLYLAQAINPTDIFHPKLYLFRTGNFATIVSGSSNITNGGLVTNTECSVLVETTSDSQIWNDAVGFFQTITSIEHAEEVTLWTIKRYETYYLEQKQTRGKSRAVPTRTKAQQDFNYANLIRHFKSFDTKRRDEIFNAKTEHYKEARRVLDRIANDKKLTKETFLAYLEELVGKKDERGWWHSGSLGRLKNDLVAYYIEFAQLVRLIKENKQRAPSYVFDIASQKVKKIYGADINYVTEIMMTYNPAAFPNINKNPITVLTKEASLNIKKTYRIYDGSDYGMYCEIIEEIKDKLGLRNMLEVDSFFNDIYWKIYKKTK